MKEWVMPAPLRQQVPRKVKMTAGTVVPLLVMAFIVIAPIWAFYTAGVIPERQEKLLETNGVDILGKIVVLNSYAPTSHGGHAPKIEYIYAPKELAGGPNRIVSGWSYISLEDYFRLQIGGEIPLVYDPSRPEEARLKSRVEAGRLGKEPSLEPLLALATFGPATLIFLPMLYFPWKFYRQRRLLRWGKAAKATITGRSEYVSKAGIRDDCTYTFQDDRGVGRTGLARGTAWRQPDDPLPNADLMEVPTVVYDPDDSANHMMYPGGAWRLLG